MARQVRLFDALLQARSPLITANPPGYLRRAIEEDYPPPPALVRAQEEKLLQERRRQAEAQEEQSRRQELARRSRLDALREALSPEELSSLRREALERLARQGADMRFGRELQIRLEEDRILEGREAAGESKAAASKPPVFVQNPGSNPGAPGPCPGTKNSEARPLPSIKAHIPLALPPRSTDMAPVCKDAPASATYRGERVPAPP